MTASVLRLRSPAKINLELKIIGRRADGYHELETLLCPVALWDNLTLSVPQKADMRLEVRGPFSANVPADGSNLVWRAAALFYAYLGQKNRAIITVEKNIPPGAGLGGGSGNAAAVLYGLNAWHDYPVPEAALMRLALKLGADVPFFLLRRPARALGIGEKLTPCGAAFNFTVVIIFPGFGVSTAKIYQNFKLTLTNTPKHSICLEAQKIGAAQTGKFMLQNDLETPAQELFPEISAVRQAFYQADFTRVLMSGSGSAVFGLCRDRAEALKLASRLKIKTGWHVFTVDILNKFDIMF